MSSNKSKFNNKYKQGFFHPQNPMKYIGDPTNIKFRSSWEDAFCTYLDMSENIIRWQAEGITIHYRDLQNHSHKYFPDFYYEIMKNDDPHEFTRVIAEIKPSNELIPPEKPINESGKKLENYEYAVRTHIKNKIKWSSAIDYCKSRGMEFVIITEKHLKQKGLIK